MIVYVYKYAAKDHEVRPRVPRRTKERRDIGFAAPYGRTVTELSKNLKKVLTASKNSGNIQ